MAGSMYRGRNGAVLPGCILQFTSGTREIQAVVNALPVFATALCVSDFLLDTRTIPESYLFLKDVGTIAFEHLFWRWSGSGKICHARESRGPPKAQWRNGCLGRTVLDAFDRLEVLEKPLRQPSSKAGPWGR